MGNIPGPLIAVQGLGRGLCAQVLAGVSCPLGVRVREFAGADSSNEDVEMI